MSTITQKRPRVKPERTIRVAVPASSDNPFAVVTISVGKDAMSYMVRPIPSDFGTAFEVEKVDVFDPQTYHVNLGSEGNSCSCSGGTYHGKCKHADGLAVL